MPAVLLFLARTLAASFAVLGATLVVGRPASAAAPLGVTVGLRLRMIVARAMRAIFPGMIPLLAMTTLIGRSLRLVALRLTVTTMRLLLRAGMRMRVVVAPTRLIGAIAIFAVIATRRLLSVS